MKSCSKCGAEKPLDDFHRDSSRADGRQRSCKRCKIDSAMTWQRNNPDRARQIQATWYAAHSQEQRQRAAAYRAANADKIKAYREANYAVYLENNRRRRARLREVTVEPFAFRDLLSAWDEFGLVDCVYCPDGEFEHVDHVIPLSRGGAHSVENLVPSCASCNQSKGARLLEEWLPEHQARLALAASA